MNDCGYHAEATKRLEESCSHFFTHKGSWLENLHHVLAGNDFWRGYRYVMKMNDDIIISGWGLDLAWSSLTSEKKMAVFDSCAATHARATDASAGYYARFDCSPILEASEFCRRHDIGCHSDGKTSSKDTLYEKYKQEEGATESRRSFISRLKGRVIDAAD